MPKREKPECECRHDGARWIKECPAHKAEHKDMHDRAQRDYRAGQEPKR